MKIKYQIPNYTTVIKDLEYLENHKTKIKVNKEQDFLPSTLGFEIPHYTIGHGEHHIIIIAATHGCEIITTDFVIKMMYSLANKGFYSRNFDETFYTIHLVPLHNPEGFIICTSALQSIFNKDQSQTEIEKLCHHYYQIYRKDDISFHENPNDHHTKKLHQSMFQNTTYECISEEYVKLRESVKQIFNTYHHPAGSMISWRSNGLGIELNRNQPYNPGIKEYGIKKKIYGEMRYNNIQANVPGPIGVPMKDIGHFSFTNENKNILNLIRKLYREKKYCGCIFYHSTMGKIYAKVPSINHPYLISQKRKEHINHINDILKDTYSSETGYKELLDDQFKGFDDYLRVLYPGVLLVELSPMGGNPIGPYGDRLHNYNKTITKNLKAVFKTMQKMAELKYEIYENSNHTSNIKK